LKTTPSYRADIEGLRALAVVLVILYHYDVPGITGGFIGVDVFFVISGFVITQLLQRAFEKGTFQFRDFYARRIRRLVPLFLLVSTVTFLMISPFYIGDAYYIFAKSWLSSLVGLSNIYYFQELSQYFAPETRSLSLLHTWSLAVEEQFYLIWPLALYLAYRFGKGRDGHWPFRITLAATFALSVYLAGAYPSAAYYLLPARLFEFMLGTGVALFSRQLPTLNRPSAEILAGLGLAMIIATGLLLTKHDHFPGYNALWPTLGTAMVIYAGLHQTRTLTARLLSLPVMVFLGGISYSLYLWHWPILIFTLAYTGAPTADFATGALVIAASVLLAMGTVRLLEKPVQASPRSFHATTIAAVSAVLAAVLVVGAISWDHFIRQSVADLQATSTLDPALYPGALALTKGNVPDDAEVVPELFSAPEDLPQSTIDGCIADFETTDVLSCEYGDTLASRTVALAGGSHAEHWLTAVDLLGREQGFRVVTFLKMGCPLTAGHMVLLGDNEYPGCVEWSRAALDRMGELRPDYVFTTSSRPREQGPGDYTPDWYIDVWNELASYGIEVLGVRDNAWLAREDVAYRAIDCLADGGDATSCGMRRSDALDAVNPTLAASFRQPAVLPLDLTNALCDTAVCRVIEGNVLIYRDEHHLTATYMRTMAPELGRQIAAATGWW